MWGLCPLPLTWAVSDCYDGCSTKEVTLCVQGRPEEAITGWFRTPSIHSPWKPSCHPVSSQSHLEGPQKTLWLPAPAQLRGQAGEWKILQVSPVSSSLHHLQPFKSPHLRSQTSWSWGQWAPRWRVLTHTIRDLLHRSVMVCYAAVQSRANDHCSYHPGYLLQVQHGTMLLHLILPRRTCSAKYVSPNCKSRNAGCEQKSVTQRHTR